jgi:hypothetical protein
VPTTTTWDKFSALYLYLVYVLRRPFTPELVAFEDDQFISPDVYDIDARLKYTAEKDGQGKQKYGSATHRVAIQERIGQLPGVLELVGMLNQNNRDGFLRDADGSLVRLMREMPTVGHNVSFRDHRLSVIRLFWPVLETYFAVAERDPSFVDRTENPFTLDGYATMLGALGRTEDQIRAALEPIKEGFRKARVRTRQAHERANAKDPVIFTVTRTDGSFVSGHFIESDDMRIAGPYLRSHSLAVLVIRRSTGNYAVYCKGRQSFDALHAVLELAEPGLWHHFTPEGKSPQLLNGSGSRTRPPSTITPSRLIELIQRHFRPMSWSQANRRAAANRTR